MYYDDWVEEEMQTESRFNKLVATLVEAMRQHLMRTDGGFENPLRFWTDDDAVYVFAGEECICDLDLEHLDIVKAAYEELVYEQAKRACPKNLG